MRDTLLRPTGTSTTTVARSGSTAGGGSAKRDRRPAGGAGHACTLAYEGGDLPRPVPTRVVREPVCQLRDPAIFSEADRTYLLYAVAGERGIAVVGLAE